MDNITNELDEIIKENMLYRFKTELNYCVEDDKIEVIKQIIKELNKDIINYDTKVINKNKLDNFLNNMTNNKFKQVWARLNIDQKFTKLEEYINEQNFSNKKDLIKKVRNLLNENKLVSSKEVDYDKELCKINKIKDIEKYLNIK
jgi:hypothetical protein